MLKSFQIQITVEINTDPVSEHVSGLRFPYGAGFGYDYRDELVESGCLDAPHRIPAGSCYKRDHGPFECSVYDSSAYRF